MLLEEVAHTGRNNTIVFRLSVSDPLAPNPAPIVLTRCQVLVGRTLLDSSVNPEYFDLSTPSLVTLKLGSSGLPKGRHLAELYVFDAVNLLGMYWGDFMLTMR